MEKFFLNRNVEKIKKHEKKKKNVTNTTQETKNKGRWANALALYDEEGRDYLRKAATSRKWT